MGTKYWYTLCATQHTYTLMLHSIVLCCVALCCVALCCVVLCCVALCCVVLCCIVLYHVKGSMITDRPISHNSCIIN